MKRYRSRLIMHRLRMEALQHMTSKQSQMGQKAGQSTQAPHSTLSMAGGITTSATMRSDRNKETRKQLEVQRNERCASTKAMSSMLPQTVTRMMTASMKANSQGPLLAAFQALGGRELPLELPNEPDEEESAMVLEVSQRTRP